MQDESTIKIERVEQFGYMKKKLLKNYSSI